MTADAVLVMLIDRLSDAGNPEHVRAQAALATADWVAGWLAAIGWVVEQVDDLATQDGDPSWLNRQLGLWEVAR